MFLVMLCCPMDDVPLKIFSSRDQAEKFIRDFDGNAPCPERFQQLLGRDISDTNSLWLVEFDEAGEPVKADCVRFFDDEHD